MQNETRVKRMSKLWEILFGPLWQKVNTAKLLYHKILSLTYYKYIFKEFGQSSIIRAPLIIEHPEKIFIGRGVRIRDGLRLEAVTQWHDQHFSPELVIDDGVSIEQNAHITCANSVHIGKDVTILFNATITDIDHCHENIDMHVLRQPLRVGAVIVGDFCFIGSGAKIFAGTTLGKQCIVGANAVVRGVFPDYCVIAGVPAKIIKRYNAISSKWERI